MPLLSKVLRQRSRLTAAATRIILQGSEPVHQPVPTYTWIFEGGAKDLEWATSPTDRRACFHAGSRVGCLLEPVKHHDLILSGRHRVLELLGREQWQGG